MMPSYPLKQDRNFVDTCTNLHGKINKCLYCNLAIRETTVPDFAVLSRKLGKWSYSKEIAHQQIPLTVNQKSKIDQCHGQLIIFKEKFLSLQLFSPQSIFKTILKYTTLIYEWSCLEKLNCQSNIQLIHIYSRRKEVSRNN